ncbi:bifunctional lysylphosphatidylglycerol synthetase/lysine--tRNA ligase LysX [Rudaeicoccus suwonensis]|uniref:Lysine--tRNA ligase n=1 Tax=Rudaeicoccus suwonensis TaxID=657409 RepID=A0A561E8A4_9MICO|nr:bifunctional lysylphosphatidylglycerol synthetase/lysine--tRNA ligase LysX [Rudaeicoccus suwonensis]TWE11843.1 lysyl-tRNA synthetase class II [Rudaeicoccus suwonensis]
MQAKAPKLLRGSFNPYGGATPSRDKSSVPWRERVAQWTGRLYLLAAVWSLITLPLRHTVVSDIGGDALGLVNVPSAPSLFIVCLLLALAGAIRRRLRAAHTVTVVLSAVGVLASALLFVGSIAHNDLLRDTHVRGFEREYVDFTNGVFFNTVALLIGVVALVLVVMSRREFPAKLAAGSRVAATAVLAGGLLVSFVVTLVITATARHTLHGSREVVRFALRSTFGISSDPSTPGMSGHTGYPWIYGLAGVMSTVALVLAILVFLRSGRGRQFQSADEELAVRRLLLRFGENDSLGYFATRRDKSVIFSADGQAAVTYRNEGSVSVASADPVGRPSSWQSAIEAWLEQCRQHGLYAAVLSCSEQGTKEYVEAGLKAFALGDEAIIDVESFSLRGRTMRPVRQAVTRITRAGYTTQVRRHSELSAEELAEIGRLAEEWRGEEAERGFSMALNRLGDPADGRCVIITAHDAEGHIRGFLSFVPWGVRGVSLDLMRRDRDGENGLNEFMVASLIEAAPESGIRRISLNFAVFREVFSSADQVGAGPITRINDAALSFASRFFQLESLYRSNDKYKPTWVPRLLCYDPALTVPRAGLAMGIAEGFVPMMGPRFLTGPRPSDVQPQRMEPWFVDRVREQEQALLLPAPPVVQLSEQQRVRRDKLVTLDEAGSQGYPVAVPRSDRVRDILPAYSTMQPDQVSEHVVAIAGRIRAVRDLGGVTFAVLDDEGAFIQIMVTKSDSPDAERCLWRKTVDLGDLVSVTGPVATSRNGELSVLMTGWQMAGKCLSPMPDLRATLSDDVRTRNRSLNLIVSPDARGMLLRRSLAVRAMREAFQDRDFIEVETPMLQAIHGGAAARPFKTHINAYNMELFLRIAPELYLKRLAVGGMQRIFELNRNFRNEGADATHNPEFTSLEAYEAYGDYNTMRELTREVFLKVAIAVNGKPVALRPNDAGGFDEVDLTPEWPVVTVHAAVSKAVGVELTSSSSWEEVADVCRKHGVPAKAEHSAGKLVMELYEALVEKQTTFPTFYCDFPVEVSPLARKHRSDPRLTEQWDLVAFGAEMGTAYSELTDPVDQRQRFTEQSMAAAAGDLEAMQLDEAFLSALEYAMPPTGGLGFGVDRLVMMLVGQNIKATLAFPFVRPQGGTTAG